MIDLDDLDRMMNDDDDDDDDEDVIYECCLCSEHFEDHFVCFLHVITKHNIQGYPSPIEFNEGLAS